MRGVRRRHARSARSRLTAGLPASYTLAAMPKKEHAVLKLAKAYAIAVEKHKAEPTMAARRAVFNAEIALLKKAQNLKELPAC